MASTKPTYAVNVITTIGTTPEERAITTDAFKAKFDETDANQKAWEINHCNENDAEFATKSDKLIQFVAVTASKTFALTDADKLQMCNHATVAINLTIPPNASVAFPVGTVLAANMVGAAQVAFVAGSGVTITPSTKLKINAQNDTVSAIQTEANKWLLVGPTKA